MKRNKHSLANAEGGESYEFYWPGLKKCIVWEYTSQLQLVRLSVLPDWQGQGVGSAVIRQLQKRGKRIALCAVSDDDRQTDLERFYLRHGFKAHRWDAELFIWEPQKQTT